MRRLVVAKRFAENKLYSPKRQHCFWNVAAVAVRLPSLRDLMPAEAHEKQGQFCLAAYAFLAAGGYDNRDSIVSRLERSFGPPSSGRTTAGGQQR